MTERRDWLLAQMGIDQYRLRRPEVLQGEVAIAIKPTTKLVIVGLQRDELHHPFISDVLLSMIVESANVLYLSVEQLPLLPQPLSCLLWFVGHDPQHRYASRQILSPPFATLIGNAEAKRTLWQQFCDYDDNL
ncbi:DNA polymerase III subunit psi [Tatumella sp. TA1]|uniref:DNA polymerase III subunit psi n=1 Tax=Rosenbergiella collisarenosi TaxID=1544695 RepID=UPI0008F95197|nr:DNA polymerase III subunit psi [Rosenbergiella collisarenosi]MBT0720016.1 DNA polymerase III subunit psi [Rosenbergiella collisarenosi]QGX90626.1 DNA polymerase III subunit psi [Tatumella sp. TA1]